MEEINLKRKVTLKEKVTRKALSHHQGNLSGGYGCCLWV